MENSEYTHLEKYLFSSYCVQCSDSILIMQFYVFKALRMILNNVNMAYFIRPPERFCKMTRYYDSDITHEETKACVHKATVPRS